MYITLNNGKLATSETAPAGHYAELDFDDVVFLFATNSPINAFAPLNGDEIAVLEDGEYWQGSDVTQEALEEAHELLSWVAK